MTGKYIVLRVCCIECEKGGETSIIVQGVTRQQASQLVEKLKASDFWSTDTLFMALELPQEGFVAQPYSKMLGE